MEFDGASAVGDVINSSDNVYNATLTGKTEDGNIDSFFFNSTLLVLEPSMDRLLPVEQMLLKMQPLQ